MQTNGKWESGYNRLQTCTICAFKIKPTFYLKGLCNEGSVDWVFHLENEGHQVVYKGYKNSKILYKNESWVIVGRRKDITPAPYSTPFFQDIKLNYLSGRKEWSFENNNNAECKMKQGKVYLTMSPCMVGRDFTCKNGDCINIYHRCDGKDDCDDRSDEEDCRLYKLKGSYSKTTPPVMQFYRSSKSEKIVELGAAIEILSVEDINLDNNKIEILCNIELNWRDNRLSYYDIHESNHTILPLSALSEIWSPFSILHHKNAVFGTIKEDLDFQELSVRVNHPPIMINGEVAVEELEYLGQNGMLYQKLSLNGIYNCVYDLYRFPFDKQVCTIRLELKNSHGYKMSIDLKNLSIIILGTTTLKQFETTEYYPHLVKGKSSIEFGFVLKFDHKFHKQIINLYFQQVLLWFVSYFTIYIDVADFSNRFMGTVTALLVLSTLIDNMNTRMPPTANIRLIDIWNIWYIVQIILIIGSHIFINSLLQNRVPRFGSAWRQSLRTILEPENFNRMAKIVFPVLNTAFAIYYFSHNYYYEEMYEEN